MPGKTKRLFPAFCALIFSAALIAFSTWYLFFFNSGGLYKTAAGIPAAYGINTDLLSGKEQPDLSYKVNLENVPQTFVLRMYGEDFNFKTLDSALALKKETQIIYHPMKNEHGEFEVYKIMQSGKEVYTFSRKFSLSSSRWFGWVLLAAGMLFFVLGLLSLKRRRADG